MYKIIIYRRNTKIGNNILDRDEITIVSKAQYIMGRVMSIINFIIIFSSAIIYTYMFGMSWIINISVLVLLFLSFSLMMVTTDKKITKEELLEIVNKLQ